VAGSAAGRRLATPETQDVRPTSDRVKEAMFNALGSLGALEQASVLDLFAGTGGLGIEALSRGADHATFVESDPGTAALVRANLAATGLADRSEVIVSDALRYLDSTNRTFDLALLDPPYEFDAWEDLLGRLAATLAVVESDRPPAPAVGWAVLREKRYGGTVVAIIRRTGPGVTP
jgi:16S rRNA (guanine966-N2)-methyltransferase